MQSELECKCSQRSSLVLSVYSVNDSLKIFVSTHNRQAEEARAKLNELQDMLALLHEVVCSNNIHVRYHSIHSVLVTFYLILQCTSMMYMYTYTCL